MEFVVFVGPQKTASSWVYDVLKVNPDLAFPKGTKETFFWDEFYLKGLDWYLSLFDNSYKTISEVGPSYFTSIPAMNRIKEHFPNAKVVITLRDPVKRAFSMYLHHKNKGRHDLDFWSANEKFPEILEGSRFSKFIPLWQSAFGKENVLIIYPEDVPSNPYLTIENICKFLNVSATFDKNLINKSSNSAIVPRSFLFAKLMNTLSRMFRSFGLYRVVNFFKDLGLKKVMYSKTKQVQKISPELNAELLEFFSSEYKYLEKIKNNTK